MRFKKMESTVMEQVAFQLGSSGCGEEVKDIAINSNGDVWIT